jgi:hypothetical protein
MSEYRMDSDSGVSRSSYRDSLYHTASSWKACMVS